VGFEAHGRVAGAGGARIESQGGLGQAGVEACIERYCAQMRAFAKMPTWKWGDSRCIASDLWSRCTNALLKAERATPLHTLGQLTVACGRQAGGNAPLQGD